MSENCIFCKVIKNEISANILYEDENFMVILDAFPSTFGHTLIIPKKHYENIFQLPDEISKNIFVLTKKIGTALKEELNFDGLNIVQNNGEAAGQTVNHFHIHLIPRYNNEEKSILIKWNTKTYDSEKSKDLTEKIFNLCK